MTEVVIRVLVVDDDPMQLELIDRALSRDGFEICTVTTIAEMAAEAPKFAPHVVLVDVNLPEVTPERGIEVARDVASGAKVILYSAWEDSKLRTLVMRSGADAFISKSESVVAIGRRLRELYKG